MKRIRGFCLGFLIVILSFASSLQAATYYVDATNGDDYNDGFSPSTAWKTIAKVNGSRFDPGNQILFKRGEVWREQLTVPSSGEPGNPIVFGAYGNGNNPAISAYDLIGNWESRKDAPTDVWQAICNIEPQAVYFDGTRGRKVASIGSVNGANKWVWGSNILYVFSTTDPDMFYSNPGIEASQRDCAILNNRKNHVVFNSLTIVGNNENDNYGAALYLCGDFCEVKNCIIQKSWQCGIVCEKGQGCFIHHNIITNNGNDGIWNCFRANGTKICNNNLIGNGFDTLFDSQNLGIWNSSNVEIYNNYFNFNGKGYHIEIGSDDYSATGIKLYGNFIDDSEGRKRTILIYNGSIDIYYNIIVGNSTDTAIFLAAINTNYKLIANIFNNTIYNAKKSIWIYDEGSVHPETSIVIKNNISMNPGVRHIRLDSFVSSKSIIDYNCYYPDAGTMFRYESSNYNFAGWKDQSMQDKYSICQDPEFSSFPFSSREDFMLKSTSPCIDAGTDVGFTKDYIGTPVPLGSGVDIGAYEYVEDDTPPAPPKGLKIQ